MITGSTSHEVSNDLQTSVARNALLEVRDLRHSYGGREVLNGVSFQVARGESLALLGRNGSGKSTALGILAGSLRRQSGLVFFEGKESPHNNRNLKSKAGVVFQTNSLDLKLTALQNLELAGSLFGLSRLAVKAQAHELLSLADLSERKNEAVNLFSGGMRRRLDVVRALMHSPEILLMDEPTVGFDEVSFTKTWHFLEKLQKKDGLSIVLATHRGEEAEKCSQVAVLVEGKIETCSSPLNLKATLAKDVLTLEVHEPKEFLKKFASHFNLPVFSEGTEILIECDGGHELIPRVVEYFPVNTIKSISLRQASMADVFRKILADFTNRNSNGGLT